MRASPSPSPDLHRGLAVEGLDTAGKLPSLRPPETWTVYDGTRLLDEYTSDESLANLLSI